MIQYTHEFCVEREVKGEDVEFTLQVELNIEPFVRGKYFGPPEDTFPDEGGIAEINGPIMVQKENGNFEPWPGELTEAEVAKVQENGYAAWERDSEDIDEDDYDDYDVLDFAEDFRDDRAIAIAGRGKVFY